MRALIPLMVISLLLASCDFLTNSEKKHAEVVIIGEVLYVQIGNNYRQYEGRIKNVGEISAYNIKLWVTCFDSLGNTLGYFNWNTNDTLMPNLSKYFAIGTDLHVDSIATEEFDVEWLD